MPINPDDPMPKPPPYTALPLYMREDENSPAHVSVPAFNQVVQGYFSGSRKQRQEAVRAGQIIDVAEERREATLRAGEKERTGVHLATLNAMLRVDRDIVTETDERSLFGPGDAEMLDQVTVSKLGITYKEFSEYLTRAAMRTMGAAPPDPNNPNPPPAADPNSPKSKLVSIFLQLSQRTITDEQAVKAISDSDIPNAERVITRMMEDGMQFPDILEFFMDELDIQTGTINP
jgi:hypothetical protein